MFGGYGPLRSLSAYAPLAMSSPAAVVEAAFAGAARGGASRQVMAAMLAALLRTEAAIERCPATVETDTAEVDARIAAIRPIISARVAAEAAPGKQVRLDTATRAGRNIAVHNFSLDFGLLDPKDFSRVQRGGKARDGRHKQDCVWGQG